MANPQAENRHIDIANEVAEQLMWMNLNSYQWRVLWAIWRKTYGSGKKNDIIPVSQLCKMTGIHQAHVSRALKELELMNMITRTHLGTRQKVKIGFQKNYEKWQPIRNKVSAKFIPNEADTKGGNFVSQCPHQEIISLYHELLPELPKVREWTEERQKALRTTWEKNGKRQNLRWWREFFICVRECASLMGENPNKWQASLGWLVKEKNLMNVLKGRYYSG